MSTPIVTLTTDWGEGSFFSGMVKGLLARLVDGVQVMDITHRLPPFDILKSSFVIRQACMGFPAGTVHIIDVATQQPYLCVKARGQYYMCCDNGLPAILFGDDFEDAARIDVDENKMYNFAAYSVFVPAAAMLLQGATLRDLGERPERLSPRGTMPLFMQQGDSYRITIQHIDNYGNAYLGMTYSQFEELRAGRKFVLMVRDQEVTELMTSYYQQHASTDPRRKLRLTVSATGLLELAVKGSSLTQLLGLREDESVLLRFKD